MEEYQKLNKKIEELREKIELATFEFIRETSKSKWDYIFSLMTEIQTDFKTIRYPKKFEREEAWINFCNLRNSVYDFRNKKYLEKSKFHYDELISRLSDADYGYMADKIAKEVLWGAFKVTIDTMKARGQMLKEAGIYFKENKHEMTKDHKTEVHEKFIEVREAHDIFWERTREYKEEKQKIWEEKKQAYEEKKQKSIEIKERMITNKEKLENNLNKAEDYLSKLESQKENLQDKIDSAYSDSYREKHEGWLSEVEDKIVEVEGQIEKFKTWIKEIEDKLDNWR